MGELIGLIAVAGSITAFIVVAYLFINSRHKVRMALIQHGKEASIFKEKRNGSSGLKYGLLMVGIGTGILVGMVIESIMSTDSPVPHFSMMLILGGAGLIIYYLITKREDDEIVS
ncbi:MAG: DUF6249 domain-containing protein [Saprospiraceae bacterium]